MRRLLVPAVLAVLFLASTASPSAAIINGEPDTTHENVGALVIESKLFPGEWLVLCTGMLLSSDTVLSAGHAVPWLEVRGVPVDAVFFTLEPVFVPSNIGVPGFVEEPSTKLPVTGWHLHPMYRDNLATAYYDVAVFDLGDDVTVTPVELPAPWALSNLASAGQLRGHSFTTVGYGYSGIDRSLFSPNVTLVDPAARLLTEMPFMGLTHLQLKLLTNLAATGEGGSCFGDSGGPVFWDGTSNVALAINTSGDPVCRALSQRQRLDLPAVLNWLAAYR